MHLQNAALQQLKCNPAYLTQLAEERTAELLAEEVAEQEQREEQMRWETYDRKCVQEWEEKQKLVALAEEAKQLERLRIQKVDSIQFSTTIYQYSCYLIQEFQDGQQRKEDARQERLRVAEEKRRLHELLVHKIDEYIRGAGPQPEELKAPIDSNPSKELCSFFTKTASCRFGVKCTRNHRRPGISRLVLIQNLFEHVRLEQQAKPTYSQDLLVEYDDGNLQQIFVEFFDDVLPELEKFGRITQLRVCRNQEAHLRGNVFVEFETER